jgi:ribonucleoside-diphosphate reductase alpha chain
MHQNKEVSEFIYREKYLQPGETFEEGMTRIAGALQDNEEHFRMFRDILLDQRFLPAGRIQVAVGATRSTTPYNCFVSGTIDDSMDGICSRLTESLQTMRLGGGIGYDFSTLRPSGERIRSLDSHSCGPVGDDNRTRGFMDLFDAGCSVISSAGHRRGAQMAVLRVDHPDIRHFIHCKRTQGRLTNFNISVGITDEFMAAVAEDGEFNLRFDGRTYETIRARNLWDEIMRNTWDYAEPGVLFLDTINKKNNLRYCEDIVATNPCGEQPLPPFGACLLGSFNLTKYIHQRWVVDPVTDEGLGPEYPDGFAFNWEQFKHDIPHVVRSMDNVIDRAIYPLPEQEIEAKSKRRMGLGITGLANTGEILGYPLVCPRTQPDGRL